METQILYVLAGVIFDRYKKCVHLLKRFGTGKLIVSSICTFQYVKPMKKFKCILTTALLFWTIFGVIINLFPTAMFLYNWIKCPVEYEDICYTLQFYVNTTNGTIKNVPPILVKRDDKSAEHRIDVDDTKDLLQKFEDLSKVFILFATSGSSLSCVLFVLALWRLYFRKLCCSKNKIKALDPFNDSGEYEDYDYLTDNTENINEIKQKKPDTFFDNENEDTSTLLQGTCKRLCPYYMWFLLGLGLLVLLYGLFFGFYYSEYNKYKNEITTSDSFNYDVFIWQAATLVSYGYSLLCTFVSCFIFSKLMYAIQRKCEEMELYVHYVNEECSKGCGIGMYKYLNKNYNITNNGTTSRPRAPAPLQAIKHDLENVKEILSQMLQADPLQQARDYLNKVGPLLDSPEPPLNNLIEALKHLGDTQHLLAERQKQMICNEQLTTNINILNKQDVRQKKLTQSQSQLSQTLNQLVSLQEEGTNLSLSLVLAKLILVQEKLTQTQIQVNQRKSTSRHDAFLIIAQHELTRAGQLTHDQITQLTNTGEQLNQLKSLTAFQYLNKRDKHFVKTAVVTLEWFQFWFLFHWIFHIFTAFMAIGLLLDAITLLVKNKIHHYKRGVPFDSSEIGVLFMISAVQSFLLLYPCLRAATVSRTRQRVIRRIGENYRFKRIGDTMLPKFIESMKKRKFSFRLHIFCASIPYNINVAFISIIFGFIGVAVSLVTTLAT